MANDHVPAESRLPPSESGEWEDTGEVASRLKVSTDTVTHWRRVGTGPPYHRLGPKLIRYWSPEVDAWVRGDDDPMVVSG